MNNQSPLIPQGSFLEQRNKTRTRVKIAVIFVLGLHGIGLLALLMQGCGKETATAPSTTPTSNTVAATSPEMPPSNPAPGFAPTSNALAETAPGTAAIGAAASNQMQPSFLTENTNESAGTLVAGASEYKIIRGDTLSKVARKFHVALKALMAVNPGVDPTKLKVDQTIHIPPPATSAPAPGGTGTAPAATTEGVGGQHVYTVESGDYLIKVANQFGVKVKALRAANNLKTDRIRVGQKLKIPAKTAGTAEAPGASAAATSGPAATGSAIAPAILPVR